MPRPENPDSALAIVVADPRLHRNETDARVALDELAHLLSRLGVRVAAQVVPRRPGASKFLGAGKLEELSEQVAELREDETPVVVVVDGALEPGPQRELEEALGVEVLDRTGVVLRVFEQRARTRVAQAEVELARLGYELPRVRARTQGDDRVGGGGRGGRGHTNVELEKQAMRERRAALERELARLRKTREVQASRRGNAARVALVGYTNAGKSSLLRALTGGDVLVEDALFATLDATVRALSPETTPRVLISDTVGFIRNLPHSLVASFHSTLDEAREADLLLLVVDASDPHWREHEEVTRRTLGAIGADAPSLLIFNKIDRLDEAARASLSSERPEAIAVSAYDESTRALRRAILGFYAREDERDVLVVPFTEARLLADIRARGKVLEEKYTEDAAVLAVRAHAATLKEWRGKLAPRPVITTPAELLEAADRYGLELVSDHKSFETSGLDFLVLHATDVDGAPWIIRTPRRAEVRTATQREARVLDLVRTALPVAVPDFRLHADDVIAYRRLAGTPGWTVEPSGALSWAFDATAPPEPFLDSLARALAALQAVPVFRAVEAGVRTETIAEVRESLARAIEATRDALAPPEAVHARWQRFIADETTWPEHTALIHGDLHPGHLLLDPDARVIGVLDWTEARVSDPSADFVLFAGCFGRAVLEDLVRRFERAGGVSWPQLVEHALERWAIYPVVVAEWALASGNEGALVHARQLLQAVAAETEGR